jgi:hypothetical protein
MLSTDICHLSGTDGRTGGGKDGQVETQVIIPRKVSVCLNGRIEIEGNGTRFFETTTSHLSSSPKSGVGSYNVSCSSISFLDIALRF